MFTIDNDIILYGYEGSSIQTYAQEYNRIFHVLRSSDTLTNPSEFGSEEQPAEEQPSKPPTVNVGNNVNDNTGKDNIITNNSKNIYPSVGTTLNDVRTRANFTVVTEGKAVYYSAPINKKVKKISIPSNVTMNGVTYKVTGIEANALKKCKKLKKVTIGSGVTFIGKNAFSGCKNLKNVIVKSKVLKKIGKNAFKGINESAKIKVPKNKLKNYTKIFKKSKIAKSIRITK